MVSHILILILFVGMFMVKVSFLSDSGKVLASSERSVSMNFQKMDRPFHLFLVINLEEIFCMMYNLSPLM